MSGARSGLAQLRIWLWAVAGVAVVATGILYLLPSEKPEPTPAESYANAFGGSFDMIDQNGKAVTDQTLRGKPYAIFFGFTRCPDVCPTTLSRTCAGMAARRAAASQPRPPTVTRRRCGPSPR